MDRRGSRRDGRGQLPHHPSAGEIVESQFSRVAATSRDHGFEIPGDTSPGANRIKARVLAKPIVIVPGALSRGRGSSTIHDRAGSTVNIGRGVRISTGERDVNRGS